LEASSREEPELRGNRILCFPMGRNGGQPFGPTGV
jgi:hypothetical protein